MKTGSQTRAALRRLRNSSSGMITTISGKAARMPALHLARGRPNMTDRALSALTAAWATATIVSLLLVATLALARVWDSAIYVRGLEEVLSLDV